MLLPSFLTESMQNKSGMLAGIMLGIGIGFLVASGLVFFVSGWLFIMILPMVLPILGGALFGGLWGHRHIQKTVSRLTILLIVVIGWPTALVLPYAIQVARLHWIARFETPVFPGAEEKEFNIRPIPADSYAGFTIKYKTRASQEEIFEYYKQALNDLGCVKIQLHTSLNCKIRNRRYNISFSEYSPLRSHDEDVMLYQGQGGALTVSSNTSDASINWITMNVEI